MFQRKETDDWLRREQHDGSPGSHLAQRTNSRIPERPHEPVFDIGGRTKVIDDRFKNENAN